MVFVVLCPGTPEGSTGSGSDFKASQKTGQRLKVSSDRLGEAGNRTCDPWSTRHRFIPYTIFLTFLTLSCNKQLNWKLESVKYFKIKYASKIEAYLMKKYGFKYDWFYTVTDKRADFIDIL